MGMPSGFKNEKRHFYALQFDINSFANAHILYEMAARVDKLVEGLAAETAIFFDLMHYTYSNYFLIQSQNILLTKLTSFKGI